MLQPKPAGKKRGFPLREGRPGKGPNHCEYFRLFTKIEKPNACALFNKNTKIEKPDHCERLADLTNQYD